jgi:Ni,Fe-hydrogenase I small subunit
MSKPPAHILTPLKDYCLNCEEHKWIKAHASLNNRIGYICVECYNTNIWAKEDNQRYHSLLNLLLHTKLFNSKIDIT